MSTSVPEIDTEDLLLQALLAHRDLCAALRRRTEVESGMLAAGLAAGMASPPPQGVPDDPDAE